jgi:hypothetical protein
MYIEIAGPDVQIGSQVNNPVSIKSCRTVMIHLPLANSMYCPYLWGKYGG